MSRQLTYSFADARRGLRPASKNRSRPLLESLEGRVVLTVLPGINAPTLNIGQIPLNLSAVTSAPASTGLSFVEQQGFPSTQATTYSSPTAFSDQLAQAWQGVRNGTITLNGLTLQQTLTNSVIQGAQALGTSAYDISNSVGATGTYSAQLDTSGTNPVLSLQYHVGGNQLTYSTHSTPLKALDPTFHTSFDLTIVVNLSFQSNVTSATPVTATGSIVISNAHTSTNNIIANLADALGAHITDRISSQMNGRSQDISGLVPTGSLNLLMTSEAAKGYSHVQAGLDGNGNLQLTGLSSNLVVTGNLNDTISVSSGANGSVQVTEGGQSATFDPGYLRTITLTSGGGTSNFFVNSLPAGIAVSVVDNVAGTDNVHIGSGSLSGVAGSVNVSNKSGTTYLTVDDSADPGAVGTSNTTIGITGTLVQFGNRNVVSYGTGVKSLDVHSGISGVTNVMGTATNVPVSVLTGSGFNLVDVYACSSAVSINSLGNALVDVGRAGSLAGIQGTVNVSNNSGWTDLDVDDSNDTTAHSVSLTNSSVGFSGLGAINYANYGHTNIGVTHVEVDLGPAADTVAVASVSPYAPMMVLGHPNDTFTGPAASQITRIIR